MSVRNILLLSKGFPPETGGVESYSKSVADAYYQGGQNTFVLTAMANKAEAKKIDTPYSCNAICGTAQIFLLLKFICALIACRFKGAKFDFIHATTWRMSLAVTLIYSNTPLVITCHGNEIFVSGMYKCFMNHVLRKAVLVVCVSDYTRTILLDRVPNIKNKVIVAWNGLGFHPKKKAFEEKWLERHRKTKIFTVCRHEERKNLSAAIQAVSQLDADIEYLIAGKGPLTQSLSDQIEILSAGDKVTLLGRVSDKELIELYSQSHIFLHPQIELVSNGDVEGFGLVVADSMSFACAAIVGANGGAAELVQNGETGLALNKCNADEIKSCLEGLLDDFDNMKSIAKKGREHSVKNFSWDRHASEILRAQNLVA